MNPIYPGGRTPKRCAHQWITVRTSLMDDLGAVYIEAHEECSRCGRSRDQVAARRSRNNNRRGRAIQRERIVGLGGTNLAGNNENLDGISALFAFEAKSGASFSERYWRWLKDIPLLADQVGVLIVTDAPGPGRKARSIVVVDYDDWRALHGEDK